MWTKVSQLDAPFLEFEYWREYGAFKKSRFIPLRSINQISHYKTFLLFLASQASGTAFVPIHSQACFSHKILDIETSWYYLTKLPRSNLSRINVKTGNQTSIPGMRKCGSAMVELYIGKPQEGNLSQLKEWHHSPANIEGQPI